MDNALRHPLAEVLYQQPHTAVLWKCEGVKTQILPPVKGTQGADRGSEAICCWRDDHQLLALKLGRQFTGARRPQPSQEGAGIVDTCNKNWRLVWTLSCRCCGLWARRPLYRVSATMLLCYWSGGTVVGAWLVCGYPAVWGPVRGHFWSGT
jgi:hypothetical protein